jgi:hypothetical protein
MSENDGLNVLKKLFNNSVDLLIDNLKISSNRLYIKGVENNNEE